MGISRGMRDYGRSARDFHQIIQVRRRVLCQMGMYLQGRVSGPAAGGGKFAWKRSWGVECTVCGRKAVISWMLPSHLYLPERHDCNDKTALLSP